MFRYGDLMFVHPRLLQNQQQVLASAGICSPIITVGAYNWKKLRQPWKESPQTCMPKDSLPL